MKSEAFEAYSAQSGGDGEQPEELSVVIQLNDRDGDTPRLLGVAPMIDGLVSGQREFACEGGRDHDTERPNGRLSGHACDGRRERGRNDGSRTLGPVDRTAHDRSRDR